MARGRELDLEGQKKRPPPTSQSIQNTPKTYDDYDNAVGEFEDFDVRQRFIRKVFMIVSMQLIFTSAMVAVFVLVDEIQEFVREHMIFYIIAVSMLLILLLIMCCSESSRRVYPCNVIMLTLFTICMSFVTAVIACKYAPTQVLMAAGITTLIVIIVTLFAITTTLDLTGCGLFVIVSCCILMLGGIGLLIWPNKMLHLVLSCVAALLFSFYLIYDIQLIMGNRRYKIEPEEYVFAALNVYIDIIQIFLNILSIIGILES